MQKLHSSNGAYYKVDVDTNLTIATTSTLSLYGIGIFVKARDECKEPATVKLNILITKEQIVDSKIMQSLQLSKIVPVSDQLRTEEIMFEKVTIDGSFRCKIRVQILDQQDQKLLMFCQWRFKPVDNGIWDLEEADASPRHYDYDYDDYNNYNNNCYYNRGYTGYSVAQNCLSYVMYST